MPALGTTQTTDTSGSAPEPTSSVAVTADRTQMTGQVALLSAMWLVGSMINYVSNLLFARVLTPASYGDLSSLLALFVVISVPFTAAQTRVAARVSVFAQAGNWERVQFTVRNALAHLTVIAIFATALYALTIPLVRPLFHLQAIGPAIALSGLIFIGFLFPVLQGALQGLERWALFGAVGVAIAISRLAAGVPWALNGGGAGGAIAGQALGMSICLAALIWMMRPHVRRTGNAAAWAGVRRRPDLRGIAAGTAFICFAVIANCDVVLAKIFLKPHEAGDYATLSTIGSIVTYLPAAVAPILVPNAIKAGGSLAARRRLLRFCALMVALIAVVAMIPGAVDSRLVIKTMFGSKYLASANGVLPIVIAGAGLAILYLLVTFTVAIEDTRWTWLLVIGVGLQVIGIALFHHSATEVAIAQAAAVLILLVINEIKFHPLLPWPGRD